MRTGIRIILCTALVAIAATMAMFTLAGFSPKKGDMAAGTYVLGESGGNVAVYEAGDLKNPMLVTDIELGGLREADKNMISSGLIVSNDEELMSLLEDLGS